VEGKEAHRRKWIEEEETEKERKDGKK